MKKTARLSVALASAMVMLACGGNTRTADRRNENPAGSNPLLNSDARPQPVTATGCLTAANGRFVVTELNTTAAVPTTTTFQLTGGDEAALQKQVNREVRVAGEADAPRIADLRNAPTPAVGTSGTNAGHDAQPGTEPRVKTQESMRFDVRNLKVLSVTATGNPCPSAPASSSNR